MVSEAVEAECERGDPKVVERRRTAERGFAFPPSRMQFTSLLPPLKSANFCSWNFRHIANVRIRCEVERILANHGYTKTTISTPEELV